MSHDSIHSEAANLREKPEQKPRLHVIFYFFSCKYSSLPCDFIFARGRLLFVGHSMIVGVGWRSSNHIAATGFRCGFFCFPSNIANHRFGTRQNWQYLNRFSISTTFSFLLSSALEFIVSSSFFASSSVNFLRSVWAKTEKGKEKGKKSHTQQIPVTNSILTASLRGHITGPVSIY
jgi:hypothetical protein